MTCAFTNIVISLISIISLYFISKYSFRAKYDSRLKKLTFSVTNITFPLMFFFVQTLDRRPKPLYPLPYVRSYLGED